MTTMRKVGGWLGSRTNNATSKSMTALDELQALQQAMMSAAHIMNDDVERAEQELSTGTSPFHKLGRATALFLRATLGFEKDTMEQAAASLAEAEEAAAEHQRRAIRDPSTAHQSRMYPAGAEYGLCHAESQLMSCIVAILNESLTESLKGFYKLRRAFSTLNEISQAEKRYIEAHDKTISTKSKAAKPNQTSFEESRTPAESSGILTPDLAINKNEEFDLVEKKELESEPMTPNDCQGHHDLPDLSELELQETVTAKLNGKISSPVHSPSVNANATSVIETDSDFDFESFTSDPIDLFIHSGTNLCFGFLQILLSMVPPAFARILSLFSFRGDRDTGLRMVWRATKFKKNINGAMAGLMTLGFHNAAIGFCDIKLREAMPHDRLRRLLREMRQLYPKSKLWLLEEARMLGEERELGRAATLISECEKSSLRQVEALGLFEYSLFCMYLHRYEESAESFVKCVDLNSWSHALYYYNAGACYVELYRIHKVSDPEKAKDYAEKADRYLHMVPERMGKKRIMGRQLPFDTFVNRKITKWDARAKSWNCQFVDAVGVSPVVEMAYFWSGFKRMGPEQLQISLDRLSWSANLELNPRWKKDTVDEKAILNVLKGTCLRSLGQTAEAKKTLKKEVLCHETNVIKACEHPDTWPLPVAHYEMAVCHWDEAPGQDGDHAALRKCSERIAKVEKWEAFDLETRVGLKVATARETLKRCGIQ